MIKTFDRFTGCDIINTFSVMFANAIARSAGRNINSSDRFMRLAKKHCNDININGIYPYAYIKNTAENRPLIIVFVYGKYKDDNKERKVLFKCVPDTFSGDEVLFIFPDEIERVENINLMYNLAFKICAFMDNIYVLETIIGIICSNSHTYNTYLKKWKNNMFDHHDDEYYKEHYEPIAKKIEELIYRLTKIYEASNSSFELVREINYGEEDYLKIKYDLSFILLTVY